MKRVIVDENVGRNSSLWHEFQRILGGQPWDYVFLSEVHPGIPDVEILDKLLQPNTVLLTGDCVLHERAIQQGIRSYTLDQQGQLTRRRQPTVKVSRPLAQSVYTDLQDDYRHKADHELTGRLKSGLSEKQFKRYRLLQSVSCLTLHPCVKGRFFDSMQRKLEQLNRTSSNEVTRIDFAQLAKLLSGERGKMNLVDC